MAVDLVFSGDWFPPPGSNVPLVFSLGGGSATLGVAVAGGASLGWAAAAPAGSGGARMPWGVNESGLQSGAALPWGANNRGLQSGAALPWGKLGAASHAARVPWQRSRSAGNGARLSWERARSAQTGVRLPWSRAIGRERAIEALWGRTRTSRAQARLPWARATGVFPPNSPLPVDWSRPPSPVLGWENLRFCAPAPGNLDLVFGLDPCAGYSPGGGPWLIAPRSAYVQTHILTAVRLPDLTAVPLRAFSLATDEGSYGWTLSASGPESILSTLAPAGGLPAGLRVTIDGLVWEFVVEGLRRNRQFGEFSGTVTARSESALLAEPYSPQSARLNVFPMTAQQIAEDALAFTGVGLDWRVTDWLVPAGAWSHTGTPLAAVRAVADAIGAIVQSPRSGSSLIVAPRYPVLPWNWAAAVPEVTIGSLDPVIVEGYERADRPAYEGVYVSGQAQGVLAQVKRVGTAPAIVLPMVTDPLITHLDAARQRGEALLGAAGAQARMTLTLPVLTGAGEPGVIDVNRLVKVLAPDGAWFGMVRSVSVNADPPSVTQTLLLERHL